jgi:hypothetical protein
MLPLRRKKKCDRVSVGAGATLLARLGAVGPNVP